LKADEDDYSENISIPSNVDSLINPIQMEKSEKYDKKSPTFYETGMII
jgi:hypothetical protein